MQEIRLKKMSIRNFKGIRELDIDFDGKDINVLGDNGTGKTSIIDSFTWLLFGKDSLGRAEFGIKPTDKEGEVIHQLETSVEAVFDISGIERVFKKTLSEVWTRKRGAAEAEFTRNENNFYIDGVPKKKSEYNSEINQLINEEVFKIITNPLYFNESVKWQDRRSVLLAICGEISDEEVIAANTELAPLIPLLQGKSVSDFKAIAASAMKRINQELDMIPVKINEAERAKPTEALGVIDYERKEALTKEIEELRIKKSNIQNGVEVQQEQQKIEMLKFRLKYAERESSPIDAADYDRVKILGGAKASLQIDLGAINHRIDKSTKAIAEKQTARQGYEAQWDKIFNEKFTDNICPTCHRELPEDEVENKRKEFNTKKAKALDEIERLNKQASNDIAQLTEAKETEERRAAEITAEIEDIDRTIHEAKATLAALEETQKADIAEIKAKIAREIEESEALIEQYRHNNAVMVNEIVEQITIRHNELSDITDAISKKALMERQDKRIAELREEQKKLAADYTTAERNLYLAEQFIVAKVNMLDERINQKFKYAKFKLFDKQINGGINEVCEVTYNGIPYKDLNNAMRINIGLDTINTISAHYGIAAPIMIDNAESVNEVFHTDAQQIRFYVSHDKKLKF